MFSDFVQGVGKMRECVSAGLNM